MAETKVEEGNRQRARGGGAWLARDVRDFAYVDQALVGDQEKPGVLVREASELLDCRKQQEDELAKRIAMLPHEVFEDLRSEVLYRSCAKDCRRSLLTQVQAFLPWFEDSYLLTMLAELHLDAIRACSHAVPMTYRGKVSETKETRALRTRWDFKRREAEQARQKRTVNGGSKAGTGRSSAGRKRNRRANRKGKKG